MKKYILIAGLSLLGSAYAMDSGLTPEEKRDLLARAAEGHLILQQSGQIEEQQQENHNTQEDATVLEEEDGPELSCMADCIRADQELINSILNPPKEQSKIASLKEKCFDELPKSFIISDEKTSWKRLKISELLNKEYLNRLPVDLRQALIVRTLHALEKSNIVVIQRDLSYYLLKHALLNYGYNLMHNKLFDAMKLFNKELEVIFSSPYCQTLSSLDQGQLQEILEWNNSSLPEPMLRVLERCIKDIVRSKYKRTLSNKEPEELLLPNVKCGFINIDKMLRLLDTLPLESKIDLMEILAHKKISEDKLNFEICRALFKSVLHYHAFKWWCKWYKLVDEHKIHADTNKYNYKKLRKEAAPIFLSSYYRALPLQLKIKLELDLKRGCNANLVEDIFSCRFYPPIKRLFYNYGGTTSCTLGLLGSYTGLLFTSKFFLEDVNETYIRLPALLIGMLSYYRVASIPLYDWEYFFNNDPEQDDDSEQDISWIPNPVDFCRLMKLQIASLIGILGGIYLYYMSS